MEAAKTSRMLRASVIAGIGAFVTVVLSIGIGWVLYQPIEQRSSLAGRVDAQRTVFFLRTTDSATAEHALETWKLTIPSSQIAAFARLNGLELAVRDSGTGTSDQSWTIEGRAGFEQNDTSITTWNGLAKEEVPVGSGSSTTGSDRRMSSLASASFFRMHVPPLSDSGTAVAYMQLKYLPSIVDLSSAPIIRALLLPFTDALLTWNINPLIKERKGMLWLKPRAPLRGTAPSFKDEQETIDEGSGTVLALRMNDPAALLNALTDNVMIEDAGFANGFKGILQYKLQQLTGRMDIEKATADLLSEPAYLRIGTATDGSHPFLFSGRARTSAVLDEWLTDIIATATPDIIRRLPLSGGEERLDVTTGNTSTTEKNADGWLIRTIESETQGYVIASSKTSFVVSNNRLWLDAFLMKNEINAALRSDDTGFMDVEGFRTFLQSTFPILNDQFNDPLFSSVLHGRLQWNTKTTPGSVVIGWEWNE